jgi:hypothetical protein
MLNSVGYLGVLQAMEQQIPIVTDPVNQNMEEPIQPPNANSWATIYAKEIIEGVKRIDDYIDELPGIESTQQDQIEELNLLEIENNMLGETIQSRILEAEQLKAKLNLALQELARDKVSGLQ